MRPIDADVILEAIERASDSCRDTRDIFPENDPRYLQWDTRLIMLQNFKDTIEQMPTLT